MTDNHYSIAEILAETAKLTKKADKVAFLKKHDSLALRTILRATYDKRFEFDLPKELPKDPETGELMVKFSPSDENHGALYREYKKIKHFIKGNAPNLNRAKKERLFLQMVETVHRDDAKVLIDMKDKKRYKGITVKVINEAIPDLVETE